MVFFARHLSETTEKDVLNTIENLRNDIKSLENKFNEVSLKYQSWLEERAIWEKDLRDKIAKKIDYLNKRDGQISEKELLRANLMRKLGLLPKNLNTSTPHDVDNGTQTKI